jgi:peptidyl-prolyl cis-trans isomerase SurA
LNGFKKEVEGSSFYKAVLYSKDQGQAQMEGIKWIKNAICKEFKDVAFSLQQGEISDPFETDFGFHIIYVEKSKDKIELRHILLTPSVSSSNCS